ncbi:hypothetical protein DFH06DRAFT_274960 [Mycena polygramma]|nr:hypothetical protein DFH06DRAFT_274960 [Mycena polygramma]
MDFIPAYFWSLCLFLALIAMYALSTIHVACRWIVVKNAFIDHAETPSSTSIYLLQSPLWLTVLGATVFSVNTLLADCVLIWRCWVVWNHDWRIVLLPLLCTVAGAGLGFRSIAEQAAYVMNPNLDRDSFIDFATPYFALSLATTALATIFIIVRILTVTAPATRMSRGYGRVIEIVVESALLYSTTLIIFLPFLVRASNDDGYPQGVLAQMTGMAPTFIVARVSLGFARPDETWQTTVSLNLSFGGRSSDPELPSTRVALSDFLDTAPSTDNNAGKLDRAPTD